MGGNKSSGDGKGNVDSAAVAQQQVQSALDRQQQQQQWEAEQRRLQQVADAQAMATQKSIDDITAQREALQLRSNDTNVAQGQAVNVTGGANGIKAAATMAGNTLGMSPEEMKLQAAGIGGISGLDALQNLARKRTLTQSNIVSPIGNALTSANSGVTFGGR